MPERPSLQLGERGRMKRWLISLGYVMAFRLCAESWRGPGWRKAADLWCGFWYHHFCPYPIDGNFRPADCISACNCGCNNLDRYAQSPAMSGGARE